LEAVGWIQVLSSVSSYEGMLNSVPLLVGYPGEKSFHPKPPDSNPELTRFSGWMKGNINL